MGLNLPIIEWSDEEGIAEEEIKSRILNAAMDRVKEKLDVLGEDNMRLIEKQIMLQIIDQNWKEHLLQLDHIRQGIGLRAYAQRDPLNEYKSEAFNLFYSMLEKIRMQIGRNAPCPCGSGKKYKHCHGKTA